MWAVPKATRFAVGGMAIMRYLVVSMCCSIARSGRCPLEHACDVVTPGFESHRATEAMPRRCTTHFHGSTLGRCLVYKKEMVTFL